MRITELRIPEILAAGRRLGASDIHLAVGELALFRVNGQLAALDHEPVTQIEIEAMGRTLLNVGQRHRLRRCGEVDAGTTIPPYGRLRVHAYRATGFPALAIRLYSDAIPDAIRLGLPQILCDRLSKMRGLMLIAGPTGSGKTTALAACLALLNQRHERHIMTIEDPIEYLIPSLRSKVTQQEVGRDTRNFDAAIYSALRSDPDVIAIGELRNAAAILAALRAAETGHFVLATIHSHDTIGALERIIDTFGRSHDAIRAQLAAVLTAVLGVKLVPKLQGGRILATEMLYGTDAVRALIREGKTHQIANAIATGRHAGMYTMEMRMTELIARGEVLA